MITPSHVASSDGHLVFEHRHSIEGFVRFVARDEVVHVDCQWPFDRETGEWIFLANRFPSDSYASCLNRLASAARGRVDGADGGFVEFAADGRDRTQIEICDSAAHSPTRLALVIPEKTGFLARRLLDALGRV